MRDPVDQELDDLRAENARLRKVCELILRGFENGKLEDQTVIQRGAHDEVIMKSLRTEVTLALER